MKAILTMILLASPALAQDADAIARATAACGPLQQYFSVKIEKTKHPLAQPEPGKALIYLIEDDRSGATNFLGFATSVTTRLGLDGSWIGANKGNSYFFFTVDPGVRHLCVDWPPDVETESRPFAVTRFMAEAERVYYFRVRLTGIGCRRRTAGDACAWALDLESVGDDEGRLLVDLLRSACPMRKTDEWTHSTAPLGMKSYGTG